MVEQQHTEPLLENPYGEPYPEEVQRLRAHVLPALGTSADDLIRDAVHAAIVWEKRKPVSYSCLHCRDGKDLPPGYQCGRCGADNPS